LQHDLAGRGAAQSFMAEGGARDVAAQAFEFLSLLRPAAGVGMQTEPLSTHTTLGLETQGAVCRPASGIGSVVSRRGGVSELTQLLKLGACCRNGPG